MGQSSNQLAYDEFLQMYTKEDWNACISRGNFVQPKHCAVFHCSSDPRTNLMTIYTVSQWFAPTHFEDWCVVVSDRIGSEYEDQSDEDIKRCFRESAFCGHDHTGKVTTGFGK